MTSFQFKPENEEPVAEHLQVRKSAGLVHLPALICLDITGEDRQKLLQGLLSNDVTGLKEGQGVYAHLLTPKGKLLAQMEVLCLPGLHRILCEENQFDVIQKNIAMRIFRSQVKLEDRRKDFTVLGLHGPQAAEFLQGLAKEYEHRTTKLFDTDVLTIREHYTGEIGCHLLVAKSAAEWIWKGLLENPKIQAIGEKALFSLTLEAGVPLFGTDLTTENLTLEANLNKAVSATKGCYLGQETVARILSRGHVAKRLVGLVIEGKDLPPAGSKIFPISENKVGEEVRALGVVTRSAYCPTLSKNLALAYLKFDFLEENKEAKVLLFSPAENKTLGQAHWVELPFYRDGGVNWLDGGPQMERVIAPQSRTK